jgi:hypothetical protein
MQKTRYDDADVRTIWPNGPQASTAPDDAGRDDGSPAKAPDDQGRDDGGPQGTPDDAGRDDS